MQQQSLIAQMLVSEAVVLVGLVLILAFVLFGIDMSLRSAPSAQRAYRNFLKKIRSTVVSKLKKFASWAWRNYKQAIIGFALGVFTTLYALGYFTAAPQ